MKKAWVFLVALALIAFAVPTFAADFAFKGDFIWMGNWDFAGGSYSGASHARVKLDSMVDKNTEFYVELREEDALAPFVKGMDFSLKNFKVSSNLTGALGLDLPVGVKLTAGYFDTYFTNWWGAESNGWVFYYGGIGWDNYMLESAELTQGAVQLDVTSSIVNLHYFTDLYFNNTMISADASFAGLGLYVGYGFGADVSGATGMDKGEFSVEAKYEVPEMAGIKIAVLPFFRYSLAAAKYTFGAGVTVDYTMFHVALGMGGTTDNVIDRYYAEASVVPVENSKVYVGAYFDQKGTSPLAGIDLGASYNFGAAKLMLGYVIAGADGATMCLNSDSAYASKGLYLITQVTF